MDKYISRGIICIKDNYNIEYRICEIKYTLNKDESFEYIFTPNYSVINLLETDIFDSIPGLDFDLKRKEYKRKNIIPTFISERVPKESRQDYYELLKKRDMDYMDPIEYLIRSKSRYSGDTLYVINYEEKDTVNIDINKIKNKTADCIRKILIEICKGNTININKTTINDNNRKEIYNILISIYDKSYKQRNKAQEKGISKAKKEKKYKGRKPIKVDKMKLLEMEDKVKKHKITSKQAADKLGISIYKYYRERNKLQK